MKIFFNNIVELNTGDVVLFCLDKSKLSIPKFNDVCYRTRSQISKGAKSLARLQSVTS